MDLSPRSTHTARLIAGDTRMICQNCQQRITFSEWFSQDCPNDDRMCGVGHVCEPILNGECSISIPGEPMNDITEEPQ